MMLVILALALIANCGGTVPTRGEPIRVSIQKGKNSVHEISMEKYVAGVLEKEVSANWPIEALKAQAIASRTYALYRKNHPRAHHFDVRADTSDQVFEKRSLHSASIARAVRETEGEVLVYNGEVFEAFFHSCCGGMSERADRVWLLEVPPPLLSVHGDAYCSLCPQYRWDYEIPRQEMAALLSRNGHSVPFGNNWDLQIASRNDSGRVSEISLPSHGGPKKIRGTTFREILGYRYLKSTLFDIQIDGNRFIFSGKGAGHGVGLCQWGAKGMAEEGKTYREILEFYYPGATLLQKDGASEPMVNLPDLLSDSPDVIVE